MSKVHAVLLIPEEGDPHGLLHEGPCGARPPRAWCCDWETDDEGETWTTEPRWLPARSFTSAARHALVLACDGKPVEVGCFYAAQGSRFLSPTRVRNIVQNALHGGYHWRRRNLEERGTLVLLDAEGREVSDE